jgi:RNA polymerase sigma-70 factor, ECF subfamily
MSMVKARPELRLVGDTRTTPAVSDGDLVLAARRGDRHAALELYERTAGLVNGLAFRLLGNDHELDDIVQDVYLSAFGKLAELDAPQAFVAWISSIVVHTVQKRLAKRKRRRLLGLVQNVEVDPEVMVGPAASPDVAAEIRRVYRIASNLPTEERVALILRRVEGYSIDEISEAMTLSVATVKRRLAAAERGLVRGTGEGGS